MLRRRCCLSQNTGTKREGRKVAVFPPARKRLTPDPSCPTAVPPELSYFNTRAGTLRGLTLVRLNPPVWFDFTATRGRKAKRARHAHPRMQSRTVTATCRADNCAARRSGVPEALCRDGTPSASSDAAKLRRALRRSGSHCRGAAASIWPPWIARRWPAPSAAPKPPCASCSVQPQLCSRTATARRIASRRAGAHAPLRIRSPAPCAAKTRALLMVSVVVTGMTLFRSLTTE